MKGNHKPYVKYCDDNRATVAICLRLRTGERCWFDYCFKKKNGRWKYVFDKGNVSALCIIAGVLLLATVVYFIVNRPPMIFGLVAFLTIFTVLVFAGIYHPIKAYCILKDYLKKV